MKRFAVCLMVLLSSLFLWAEKPALAEDSKKVQLAKLIKQRDALLKMPGGPESWLVKDYEEFKSLVDRILELDPSNRPCISDKFRMAVAEGDLGEARSIVINKFRGILRMQTLTLLEEHMGIITKEEADARLRDVTAHMREQGATVHKKATRMGEIDGSAYIAALRFSGEMSVEEMNSLLPEKHPHREAFGKDFSRQKVAARIFAPHSNFYSLEYVKKQEEALNRMKKNYQNYLKRRGVSEVQ